MATPESSTEQQVLAALEAVKWATHAATTIKNATGQTIAECGGHGGHSSVDEAVAACIVQRLNAYPRLAANLKFATLVLSGLPAIKDSAQVEAMRALLRELGEA